MLDPKVPPLGWQGDVRTRRTVWPFLLLLVATGWAMGFHGMAYLEAYINSVKPESVGHSGYASKAPYDSPELIWDKVSFAIFHYESYTYGTHLYPHSLRHRIRINCLG